MYLIPVALLVALILWRRISATNKPIHGNGMKILFPILFILFGMASFENPQVHVTTFPVLVAVGIGIVMSIPLIVTTNYEVRENGNIYAKKSVAFIVSLIALVVIRIALRSVLHEYSASTMLALFYVVAVSYVVPWRVASFLKFRRLYSSQVVGRTGDAKLA